MSRPPLPPPTLHGELLPVDRCPGLAADWQRLQDEGPSPFTSWHWVSTWLDTLPAAVRPLVFRASRGGRTHALGLLVEAPEHGAARWFGRSSWHLQETGAPDLDEITIEYGGLLAAEADLAAAYRALLRALGQRSSDWRRLRIPTSAQGEAIAAGLPAGMEALSVRARSCFRVDLAAVRAAPGGYPGVLGRSTRAMVRQTVRAYASLGPLVAETARDPTTALAWFDELERLHTRSWNARGEGGSFAHPFFGRFHRALLARAAGDGFARVVRVGAGAGLVGYLYNLAWRGTVFYYNAGLNYGLLPRGDRPGIAALHAAIEAAAGGGEDVFDFLAGEQDYKRRLATGAVALHSIDVRRTGVRTAAEHLGAGLARRAALGVPLAQALAQTMPPGG